MREQPFAGVPLLEKLAGFPMIATPAIDTRWGYFSILK
jgi:hypothetical protein